MPLRILHTRLHTQVTVEKLAREAHTSKRTLSRRFAETTGMSPLRWITVLRLRRCGRWETV